MPQDEVARPAGADVQREREAKFDVDARWTVPDLTALVPGGRVDVETVRLSSTYVDTVDRRLLAHRLTLRRRTGDTDTGWQLKVPDAGSRIELRWPVAGTTVPAEIRDATLGVRGRAALKPVATLTTVRAVHRLVDADGDVLAELAFDDVTAAGPGVAEPLGWREVEVELVEGGEKFLRRAGKLLRASGARPSASASKVGRALGVEPAPDHAEGTLARLVGAFLDTQWEVVVRSDIDLRRHEYPVHALRIALRRYRSVLRLLSPALDPERAEALDAELSWYAGVLGEVRDREVLREYLDELFDATPEAAPAADAVDTALAAEREKAEASVQTTLRSRRYLALLAELRAWHEQLPIDAARPVTDVAKFLRRADRKARARLDAIADAPDGATPDGTSLADEAMHRARKAAKRARYVAELSEPVVGRRAADAITRHKQVQKRLGGRQDAVVAAEFLRRVAAGSGIDGTTGFALGVLHERARTDAQG